MTSLSPYLGRLKTKPLLIGIVIVLAGLNLGRLGLDYYADRQEELAGKQALLEQYMIATRNSTTVQERLSRLKRIKQAAEEQLFSGSSSEQISSAMQIALQEMIKQAGLELESLRPEARSDRGKEFGEIGITTRLSGTINQYINFLANLYQSNQLFMIDSFTLKPFGEENLKIFLELRGYYTLEKSG